MKFQLVAVTAGSSPQEPGGHAPLKHLKDVMLPNTESQLGQTGCPSQPSTQTSCSVTQSCPTLCDPMDCSTPGLTVLHLLPDKFMSIESVMPSNHLILCCPLLLLSSIFPSIRDFSSESHQVAKGLELQLQHQSFQ